MNTVLQKLTDQLETMKLSLADVQTTYTTINSSRQNLLHDAPTKLPDVQTTYTTINSSRQNLLHDAPTELPYMFKRSQINIIYFRSDKNNTDAKNETFWPPRSGG
ncbi:unnamed protein product [Lactuca virosa]|uniref:Uncharacterized protein n=1 Tax=Lactuca virosa TaxID=75947 RepID=A0AAU9PER2_9ASTR|nr:unnamed protein product [Lactuca virosa]